MDNDKVLLNPPAPSLSHISFSEAFESAALNSEVQRLAETQVEHAFGLHALNATIRLIGLSENRDRVIFAYRFSEHGSKLLREGHAYIPLSRDSGRLLPILKDAKTGQILELAKGKPVSISRIANAASLVTTAAHVVSGIDVVRRLKEIDRKLNILVAGRAIDQLAELESIYNRTMVAFSRKEWFERPSELNDCRTTLFRLRAVWRKEIENILETCPSTPNSTAFEKFGKSGSAVFTPVIYSSAKVAEIYRESQEKKLYQHLCSIANLAQRIRMAIMIEVLIAQSLADTSALAISAANELSMWKGIVETFNTKGAGIRTFTGPGEIQAIEPALRGYLKLLVALQDPADPTTKGAV